MKTLVVLEQSQLLGLENFQQMEQLLQKGDNVCILSNHQTEADPQVISILLEQHNMGHIAERMIFIAGHKVTNDPVAIPFSMVRLFPSLSTFCGLSLTSATHSSRLIVYDYIGT